MDLIGNIPGAVTPIKDSTGSRESRSKNQETSKLSENRHPNFYNSRSPGPKPTSKSPLVKSAKPQKSAVKTPNPIPNSPRNKIRERKFIVAKKKSKKMDAVGSKVDCKCKAKVDGDVHKCRCVAYENLRASQEEFFKNQSSENEEIGEKSDESSRLDRAESELEDEIEKKLMIQDLQIEDGFSDSTGRIESYDRAPEQVGSSTIKRRRDRLLEEARKSVPETGSGRVMHLVGAFEKLLSLPKSKEGEEENKAVMKWALPGLQPPKANETEEESSSSSFCPLELCLTAENLGLDPQISISSSWDSNRASISSRSSKAGRRSRRNSIESSGTMGGRRWKKKQVQPRVTSQKPFNLRTEQRGKMKEEELTKKIHEMLTEEEKQQIPIAQGLPWTTDEPECLVKPPVKECTRPLDLLLHSDIRAVERAEFDYQVAEKMSLIEQYKMEREIQQKMIEEEEVRRLRKELVPKAQPMPYFDRPFIPKRSMKQPTVPKEPRFHIPEHKKFKCWLSSWSDVSSSYSFQS